MSPTAIMNRSQPFPRHELEVPTPEELPFAIGTFDAVGPLSRADFPHRHNFYEVVHVTGGIGRHVVDLTEQPLHPPHLCVIVPGQVHFWHQAVGLRGRVVLFTDEFLMSHPDDRGALRELGARPWRRLSVAESGRVGSLVTEMEREFHRRESGFTSVLSAYLHVLVVLAGRLHIDTDSDRVPTGVVELARRFAESLAAPGGVDLSVQEHAARLDVSVGYLTGAVKQATGDTPGQVIRRTRVLEAKRLLARTGLSVAQVARAVGFADPAYFCRFFRREVGTSPGDFRRRTGGNHPDAE